MTNGDDIQFAFHFTARSTRHYARASIGLGVVVVPTCYRLVVVRRHEAGRPGGSPHARLRWPFLGWQARARRTHQQAGHLRAGPTLLYVEIFLF